MLGEINALEELREGFDTAGKSISDIEFMCIALDLTNVISMDDPITEDTLSRLDFTYNSFFETQSLDGVVVFKDKTWLRRFVVDDVEIWKYLECPTREIVKQWIYATKELS